MTSIRTAMIVGGGIAGPATALALQKTGIDATVYEAHPGDANGAGVFLTLGSNGIDGLRTLGVADRTIRSGFPTPVMVMRSHTGRRLGTAAMGPAVPDLTPSHTVTRADMYAALHAEVTARGIAIEHGKRLTDSHEDADGVHAVFADGTRATADVLIGCDGVHSTVRRLIDPQAPAPGYSGLLGTGGYAHGVDIDAPPGTFEMIFGKRGFFGYVSAGDGEVWWFANVPRAAEPARGEAEATEPAELRRMLRDLFADDAGPAVALIDASDSIVPLSPMHALRRLPRWHRGLSIVVGDAAHAPSPSSGQGASLSVEDAIVLAKCLRDEDRPEAAFADYEAVRRPRVERIVKEAARVNNSKAAGPLGRVIRDAMLPVVLRLTANSSSMRRTYGHRIDWEVRAQPN